MIKLINVSKKFSNIMSLSNISFEIEDGDYFLIHSIIGGGKTVLAKLIAKIIKPDEGEIVYENIKEDDVRIMYDEIEKDTYLNTNDYLMFYGKLNGFDKNAILNDINFYFNKYNLDNLKYIMYDDLDRSQKKIINLISLLISKRKVYIIDDPYNHINENYKYIVKAILKDIAEYKTLIVSTINIDDFIEDSNKILILDKGKVSILGNTQEALKLYGYKNCIEINYEADEEEIISILNSIPNIKNYSYDKNFLYITTYLQDKDYDILKSLVDNNIKIISFKRIDKI